MAPFLSAPVREGDLLAGKYRVERVLGAGGMGIVVAARHIELEQLVAIKFVRDEAIGSEDAVQRFLREARAAVKLKSEHVARVLDVGKLESGAPYMVMEYLEGSDLGKVLTDYGPSSVDAAADWILQACEAVAEAHAAGIVHRDLKPENLFLARTVGGGQKIKVLDFGVSKAMGGASGEMSGLTRTRAMLGSPLYMAPEQMRSSRDVDARADIWALGVVLFQLLTNRWPFEAETMPELCLKVVTEPPLALATIRPDVPVGIVGVIERCLEKDPAKRFANAAELASALEPFVQPASRVLAERARLAMGIGSRASSVPGQVVRAVASSTLQSTPSRLTPATRPGSTPGAPSPSTPGAPFPSTPGAPSPSTPGAPSPSTRGASATPGASLASTPNPSSGSTPGTSAPWGTERVVTPAPQAPRRSGAFPVAVGVVVAAIAGVVGFLLVARSPATAGPSRPEAPSVESSVPPSAPAVSLARMAPASPDPVAASAALAAPPAASASALAPPSAAPLTSQAAQAGVATLAAERQRPAVPAGVGAPVVHARPATPGHALPGKPASTDDDIPTIR